MGCGYYNSTLYTCTVHVQYMHALQQFHASIRQTTQVQLP